ncbi:MAG: chromosome partitioning protein [Kiritimatiellia bacterium]|jgi:chromosome partitioning protein
MTRIVAIANQKGGVGKTTTTVNLAAGVAREGYRVLLLDIDSQANATSGLGLDKNAGDGSIYDVLIGEKSAVDCIKNTEYENLDLLPSEPDLAGAEIEIATSGNIQYRLRDGLASLRAAGTYDFIFIDCPPSLGIIVTNALVAADSVLIPLQTEYFALEGLSMITDLVNRIIDNDLNPDLELEGIVMTMYDKRTNLANEVVGEVWKAFGEYTYEYAIPRSVKISESPGYGEPVLYYAKHSTGAYAYEKVVEEFIKRNQARNAGMAHSYDALEVADKDAGKDHESLEMGHLED